jgi:hypothetical protein
LRDCEQLVETVGPDGDDDRPDGSRCREAGDGGVLPENCMFELLQRRARLDPELFDERSARSLIDVERLSLPPGTVKGGVPGRGPLRSAARA